VVLEIPLSHRHPKATMAAQEMVTQTTLAVAVVAVALML
jgi:hypothetical protein